MPISDYEARTLQYSRRIRVQKVLGIGTPHKNPNSCWTRRVLIFYYYFSNKHVGHRARTCVPCVQAFPWHILILSDCQIMILKGLWLSNIEKNKNASMFVLTPNKITMFCVCNHIVSVSSLYHIKWRKSSKMKSRIRIAEPYFEHLRTTIFSTGESFGIQFLPADVELPISSLLIERSPVCNQPFDWSFSY